MNTLNKLKNLGNLLLNSLVPIIFLIGLTLINIACYMQWGLVVGLIATGTTLVGVALVIQFEKAAQTK